MAGDNASLANPILRFAAAPNPAWSTHAVVYGSLCRFHELPGTFALRRAFSRYRGRELERVRKGMNDDDDKNDDYDDDDKK